MARAMVNAYIFALYSENYLAFLKCINSSPPLTNFMTKNNFYSVWNMYSIPTKNG